VRYRGRAESRVTAASVMPDQDRFCCCCFVLQTGLAAKYNQENALLQARNEQIGLEVTSLKSGLEQIEVKAREELGLVRPNETLFLFVNEQTHAGQRPGPQPR
jgi:hypothetical protein